jgi:hypothetical protein
MCAFESIRSACGTTCAGWNSADTSNGAGGVHPLPFAILVSLIGSMFAKTGVFNLLVRLNGPRAKAGVSFAFRWYGCCACDTEAALWCQSYQSLSFTLFVLFAGAVLYLFMSRAKIRWLVIPVCVIAALTVSAALGFPLISSQIGLTVLDPRYWWIHQMG